MKKIHTLFLAAILALACNSNTDDVPEEQACDNGTFVGQVVLTTQQQVNEFGALCYTKIDGTLVMIDLNETEDKIVDLSPLINLTEIYTETYPDSLLGTFHFRTSLLTNFEGLNNLEKVGRLYVQENLSLESFNGLESLVSIGSENFIPAADGLLIIDNMALQNLDGLNNLIEVGFGTNNSRLHIYGNPVLENIDGLESLATIHSANPSTSSENGLRGDLWIFKNHQLTNVDGLSGLTHMNDGVVSFLVSVQGVEGCNLIGNESITSFCGMQNLVNSGNYGHIRMGSTISPCYNGFSPTIQDIIDGNCSL